MLRPCVRRSRPYTHAPATAESARPCPWPCGAGEPLGAARRLGRIRDRVPVARIGRASPSAHPAGRQPTVDPVQARFARRSAAGLACGPPARHAREVLGRSGRRLALVAGILLATPAGAHATPPGGVRSPASASSAAAPSATPPSATVAAVGRPVVESITCRTGCLDISTATAGSIVRVTGEDAGSAASISPARPSRRPGRPHRRRPSDRAGRRRGDAPGRRARRARAPRDRGRAPLAALA